MGIVDERPITGPGIFPDIPKDSDRISVSNAAEGPRLGFQGAFKAALDQQIQTDSARGFEYTFQQVQEEQKAKIRAAKLEAPLSFWEHDPAFVVAHGTAPPYFEVGKQYTGGQAAPYAVELAADYDKQIAALNKAHPELQLKNSQGLVQEVQRRGQAASRRYEKSTSVGVGGVLGSIAGSMAGSFNPGSDPFNFGLNVATLGVGGSAAAGVRAGVERLAVAGAVPGVSEAINQATGVQERRRMLGLEDYGFGRAATSVLYAAGGGMVLQGAGEVLKFGSKWFRHSPNDPAPPPPEIHGPPEAPTYGPDSRVYPRMDPEQLLLPIERPEVYGPSRLGRLREEQDLAAVSRHMESWESGPPIDALPHKQTPTDLYGPPITQEEYARSIDPEAFRLWDRHNAEADALQPALHEAAVSRAIPAERAAAAKTIEDQARAVEARIAGTKSKKQIAKLTRELEELRTQRQALLPDVSMPGVPEAFRARVMRNDAKLRDLVPLISRAYAAARDAWPEVVAKQAALFPSAEARQLRMGALLKRTLTEEQALGPRELPTRAAPEAAAPADHEAFIAEAVARQREAMLAQGETSKRMLEIGLRDFEAKLRAGLADVPAVQPRPQPVGKPPPEAMSPPSSPERMARQPVVDDYFPGVQQNPDIVAKLPADADMVDKVAAVRVKEAEVQDDAVERFQAKLTEVMKPLEERAAVPPAQRFVTLEAGKQRGLDKYGPPDAQGQRQLKGIPAVFIDGKIFTGHDHTAAIDEAVRALGPKAAKQIDANPEQHIGYVERGPAPMPVSMPEAERAAMPKFVGIDEGLAKGFDFEGWAAVNIDGRIFTAVNHAEAVAKAIKQLGRGVEARIDADPDMHLGYTAPGTAKVNQVYADRWVAPTPEAAPVAQNLIQINGRTVNLNDTLLDEAGNTVTFREYLKDMNDDQEFIKSVGTCSSG